MDLTERDGINRIDREADREKTADDHQATDPRDGKALVGLMATILAATTLVLGMMWMDNLRYDGATPQAVAEQRQ